tara:strand:- start:2986 stop:3321 length:336 start_codon:yes stop_codon:yes gene_type:complete
VAKVTPQVVILGKGKQSELKATHNLIKSIQPSSVPPELLDSVFLTLVDDTRYQINSDMLKGGIDYDNMDKYVERLGLQADIRLIEVIIDLDATKNILTDASNSILNDLFEE